MALNLETAEVRYGTHSSLSSVEWFVRGRWPADIRPDVDKSAAVFVRVRQGRWLALCPWCHAAIYASELDRRFFCPLCGNVAVEGKWVPVVWPREPEAIEELLLVRPNPINRCWEPHETLDDLRAENRTAGLSSLEVA